MLSPRWPGRKFQKPTEKNTQWVFRRHNYQILFDTAGETLNVALPTSSSTGLEGSQTSSSRSPALYISGLPTKATGLELKKYFAPFGPIDCAIKNVWFAISLPYQLFSIIIQHTISDYESFQATICYEGLAGKHWMQSAKHLSFKKIACL